MEIVDAFKKAGAVVTTTFSFKQALILVEHDGLAAAILDHALGDSDSSQLCARLNERNVPFVIYSGFSKIGGACAHGPLVHKPASPDVLIATVEALLPSEHDKT
jgi:DNA-binding response OmpR family regulator